MFPSVLLSATTSGTAAAASVTVNLPSTAANQRVLMVVLHRCAVVGAIGWPDASWIELFDDASDLSDDQTACAYKWVTAPLASTITVTQGNGKFASVAFTVAGVADPTIRAPEVSTVAIGTSTTPDPTAVTPTGGAKDYLIAWLGGWSGEQTSPPTGNPANYSGRLGANSSTSGLPATNAQVAVSFRKVNTTSEDPGSWTISVAPAGWSAWALALHPAFLRRAAIDHLDPSYL